MVDADFFYKNLVKPGVIPKQGHAQKRSTNLTYAAALDYSSRPAPFRKLSIWCNVGPTSKDTSTLQAMIANGMDVACVNLSYGTEALHAEAFENIRQAALLIDRQRFVAIAAALRGADIRLGAMEGDLEYPVTKGDSLRLTTDKAFMTIGTSVTVFVDYEDISRVIQPESRIILDDGNIPLFVSGIHGQNIITTVERDGVLRGYCSVFLPQCKPPMPPLSEQDKSALTFALANDVDFILASRARDADDILAIRDFLGAEGKHVQIIGKIESYQALQNIDEIIEVSDGIFINRLNIGVEVPSEKVFIAQKNIIAKCNRRGLLAIAAMHFVHSMLHRHRPTSAESNDIANAVIDGADGIYLDETGVGGSPAECVAAAAASCTEAESAVNQWERFRALATNMRCTSLTFALALSAVEAAYVAEAAAIVTFALSGATVRALSSCRPHVPIIAIINNERLGRQLVSCTAVFPCLYTNLNDDYTPEEDWKKFIELRLEYGVLNGKIHGFIQSGDPIVVVHGTSAVSGLTDMVRVIYVSDIVKPIAY